MRRFKKKKKLDRERKKSAAINMALIRHYVVTVSRIGETLPTPTLRPGKQVEM